MESLQHWLKCANLGPFPPQRTIPTSERHIPYLDFETSLTKEVTIIPAVRSLAAIFLDALATERCGSPVTGDSLVRASPIGDLVDGAEGADGVQGNLPVPLAIPQQLPFDS
jgi:hypothetical protein